MQEQLDVLIVGAGPVGLTLALALRRFGLNPRIVDKAPSPTLISKAAVVQARTLEVFTTLGVVDAALERGRRILGADIYADRSRIGHITFQLHGTPYPFLLGLEQRDTEELLNDALEGLGGAVERPVELVGFTQDDAGVTATLRRAPDGAEEVVRARWLVGCDGAHSAVRHALGTPFEGSTFEQLILCADVGVRFPFEVDPHDALGFVSDQGSIAAFPILRDGLYRLIFLAPPPELVEPTTETIERLTALRAPEGLALDGEPLWTAAFRFHGRLAASWRDRRVFLAGDAAHIHSPAGAQGMNMGIQDAFNLAWKLALVEQGAVRPALLDSYAAERRPVAQSVVQTTDLGTRGAIRAMAFNGPVIASLRKHVVGFISGLDIFQGRVSSAVSQLSVAYPASPAVGEFRASVWDAVVAGGGGEDERELPDVRAWWRFTDGPAPGHRVPDLDLAELEDQSPTLHAFLADGRHHLLLFDGPVASDAGYASLAAIARIVTERYGDTIDTHIVVPAAGRPAALDGAGPVLLDPDAAMHQHFGAASECLYLVRPDGYVAYRSMPVNADLLFKFLATWWRSMDEREAR